MESKRENGDDIDAWELDELKNVSVTFLIDIFVDGGRILHGKLEKDITAAGNGVRVARSVGFTFVSNQIRGRGCRFARPRRGVQTGIVKVFNGQSE